MQVEINKVTGRRSIDGTIYRIDIYTTVDGRRIRYANPFPRNTGYSEGKWGVVDEASYVLYPLHRESKSFSTLVDKLNSAAKRYQTWVTSKTLGCDYE